MSHLSTLVIHRNGSTAYRDHTPPLLYDDPPVSSDDPRSDIFSRASLPDFHDHRIFHDRGSTDYPPFYLWDYQSRIFPRHGPPELDTRDLHRSNLVRGVPSV